MDYKVKAIGIINLMITSQFNSEGNILSNSMRCWVSSMSFNFYFIFFPTVKKICFFPLIILTIVIKETIFKQKEIANESIYLSVHLKGNLDLNKILMICKNNCSSVYLRDFDLVKKFFKNIGIVNGNSKKENKLGFL